MAKIVLDDVSNTPNMHVGVNSNSAKIETAFENTVSRDGTGPNHMMADLNMNGYNILNQGNPVVVKGIEWQGDWLASFNYKVGDIVRHPTGTYIAIVAHTSGDFPTDLINNRWQMFVPTPDQVNADWNATEGVAEILNKPTIIDPVNADWTAGGGLSEILNKPTISTLGASLIAATTAQEARTIIDALGDSNKNSLEFGDPTVAGGRFIDFHTSGNPTDYDSRILAGGGDTFTGNGQLDYVANSHVFTGIIVPQSTVGIKGTTTNDNAQVGSIGEYIRVTVASPITIDGTVQTILSFTLPEGDWELSGVAMATSGPAGTNTVTTIQVFMSTYSYRTLFAGVSLTQVANTPVWAGPIPRHRASRTTSGTVTMTAYGAVSAGSFTWTGEIQARRVR